MSDHHGKTGDQAAAVDTASYEGYVYVATNPAMPNLVKIGSHPHNPRRSQKPHYVAVHDQRARAVRTGVRGSNRR